MEGSEGRLVGAPIKWGVPPIFYSCRTSEPTFPFRPPFTQVVREGWVHKKSSRKVNAQDKRLYALLSSRALYFFAEVCTPTCGTARS